MCNESDQNEFKRTIRFDVPAVSESKPALRYRLFPARFERKLGNAAPVYRKAFEIAKGLEGNDKEQFDSMQLLTVRDEHQRKLNWGDDIPDELSPAEREQFIQDYAELLAILDDASLYAECDWEFSTEDLSWYSDDSLLELLFNPVRNTARLLKVRTCHALEQDDMELAIQSIKSLYAMADNFLKMPLIMNSLIASSIADSAASCVDALIASGKSPNLYWPLTQIPRFSHYHLRTVESERNDIFTYYPQLKEIDNPARDEDHDFWLEFGEKFLVGIQGHWDLDMYIDMDMKMKETTENDQACPEETLSREELRKQKRAEIIESLEEILKDHPEAFEVYKKSLYPADPQTILDELPVIKQTVLDWGYSPERIERLCAEHLVAIYTVRVHEELFDDVTKWFGVDYLTWQAHPNGKAREAVNQTVESYGTKLAGMIANTLSVFAYEILVGCEQEIDALRVVEAIRLYAASHDGKLPKKLDKITEVPIPWDPTTGKSFKYKVEKTDEGRLGVLKFTSKGVWKYRYEIRIT